MNYLTSVDLSIFPSFSHNYSIFFIGCADSDTVNEVFSAVPGKLYIIYKLDNQYMIIIILLPLLQGKFSVYFIYISSQVMKYNFLGYFCATITSSTLGMGAC